MDEGIVDITHNTLILCIVNMPLLLATVNGIWKGVIVNGVVGEKTGDVGQGGPLNIAIREARKPIAATTKLMAKPIHSSVECGD
jgi:hypothetical protein